MAIRLGDTAPDFTAETTQGDIRFHDWIGNDWVPSPTSAGAPHPPLHTRARMPRSERAFL